MPMQDYTTAMFESTMAKSHQVAMSQADRENQGMGFLAEQARMGFVEMKSSNDLAEAILNQRSASQQPQVGVVPAAVPISTYTGGSAPVAK